MSEKLTNRDEIVAALHQVMVELALLQELDKPLTMISNLDAYGFDEYSIISRTEINPSTDGSRAVLSFPDAQAKETLVAAFQRSEEEGRLQQETTAVEAEEEFNSESAVNDTEAIAEPAANADSEVTLAPPTNLNFLSINLEDPQTKFAVSLLLNCNNIGA
jgi:hypothetical protein